MSEDVIRPRPVVDPALPEQRRGEALREGDPPGPEDGGGEGATRLVRLREGGVQVLGVGFTMVLALLTAGWYLAMVIASISLVAYVAALACRRDAHPVTRAAGAAAGAGTVATAPAWLMDVVPQDPSMGMPWALFGLLVAMVTADTLTSRAYGPAGRRRREHVVLPEDLSEADHALLVRVQDTIGLVCEAREELGGEALDGDRALAVLREQEWRIASLLARQRELRRAHLRRWQRAVSPRVREALKPQREYLHAVEEAVRARVDQITEYGRLVQEAVTAHREWEQCQEALDSTAEYADHVAAAAFLGVSSAEVGELAATAALARRVRDESVERAFRGGRRLAASTGADGRARDGGRNASTGAWEAAAPWGAEAPGHAGPDGTGRGSPAPRPPTADRASARMR